MKSSSLKNQIVAIATLLILSTSISHSTLSQSGSVITFEKGLAVNLGPFVKYPRYARSEFPTDIVVSKLMDGSLDRPTDNGILMRYSADSVVRWGALEADETSYFNSDKFAYGGLYLEYESPSDQVMMFDASGHSKAYVNGIPREGDHFDFKITKIPVKLKKGLNTFYLVGGRNPKMRATLYAPDSPVMLSTDHITLPDLVVEETGFKWGGIMAVNATEKPASGYVIESIVNGTKKTKTDVPTIERLTSRRIPFQISELTGVQDEQVEVQVNLLAKSGKQLSSVTFQLKNKESGELHDGTFISGIDGSVQYYSVSPGKVPEGTNPALFLSVHGAGVQARNQAGVYASKDWGHLIAPTNRGPFGFAWEDWGRLDALEVLAIGKKLFNPDPQKIYLTGHSMGGHASWYLGASYPDYWAAIAPCAGYPELHGWIQHTRKVETAIQKMYERASNPQRTKLLVRNYLHYGAYINHGNNDQVVSVEHAREMKKILADFHPDFAYYEYPEGGHWYGKNSADWPPLFDFLKTHEIPKPTEVRKLEFYTASPGVSASSNWATIYQQNHPYQLSNVNLQLGKDSLSVSGTTENVLVMKLDLDKAGLKFPLSIKIDEGSLTVEPMQSEIWLVKNKQGNWETSSQPDLNEKGPHRSGNFKDAFRHNVVFVYGTGGSREVNDWNYYKARYDAETFGYRGNGSIEIIPDNQFDLKKYKDRGVIVYGNADNNKAWKLLLSKSPVQVEDGKIQIGDRIVSGDDLGCYFIYPRPDSDIASVGVVAGTGLAGIKAAHANQYFMGGTAFPDLTVLGKDVFEKEYESIECTGFFGNDWSVENGDFVWK
ncbi:prolyl oligopeptidase family serine peptidase [Reichenbachiella sp. MALMAid0571]|uniref:carboxylesterase family protein n=1 Tax=Reichenbachiella sp. MALMAid0571 TaxID=3143939 RepID=UPI0032DF5884